jgi:hypothetical protein
MTLTKSAKQVSAVLALASLLGAAAGCEFHARSPEDYRSVTRALIETRTSQIQSCYDDALKTNKEAKGNVTVHFFVVEDTGALDKIEALPSSTAPEALQQCVVTALQGLVLQPPDARKGDATFSFEFSANSVKATEEG